MRFILSFILVTFAAILQVFGQRFRPETNVYQNQNAIQNQRSSSYNCPEKNGRFPTSSCDSYIECKDGIPEEKLCPDGLLFNAAAQIFAFPCQYPVDVDCTGREQTQPAIPTPDCPHQYGYFKLGDSANCGQFMNCVDGRGYTFDCPEGLAFNPESYRCDWPDQVASCDSEAYLGFTCPPESNFRGLGEPEYKFYRSPRDCQRYFICINSKPRLYNCGEGRAYNEFINECDGAENVTGCTQTYNQNYDTNTQISRFQGRF